MKSLKRFSLHKLLPSCLYHLFPSQQTTSRESSIFGGPDPNTNSISNDPASATLPRREDFVYPYRRTCPMEPTLNKLQTMRVWCHNHEPYPMRDIMEKGLDDVVYVAVALQDSNSQSVPGNQNAHPQGASLVDLAVRTEGIARVLRAYGPINFVPLSDDDSIIKAQDASSFEFKRAHGYAHVHTRYLQIYSKYCQLAEVLRYEISKLTTDWFDENMENIDRHIMELGSPGVYSGDAGSSIPNVPRPEI